MTDISEKTVEKQKPDHLFKPGQSGNPNGRPKGAGISITTEIKKKLQEVPPGQKATYLELLLQRIMKQAITDGDAAMVKQIWNYVDGMPKQNMTIEGDGLFAAAKLEIELVDHKEKEVDAPIEIEPKAAPDAPVIE